MARDETDSFDIAGLSLECGRGVTTVRRWMRYEGLPFGYEGRKVVVRRADWDEWRSRPEIAAMLSAGEQVKKGVSRQHAAAV